MEQSDLRLVADAAQDASQLKKLESKTYSVQECLHRVMLENHCLDTVAHEKDGDNFLALLFCEFLPASRQALVSLWRHFGVVCEHELIALVVSQLTHEELALHGAAGKYS